ncbi:MAG: recombination protein RecR [Rhodospirillales bacterium]|nr:recombination protein RecR [Rhodospirillales bacterium]MCB9973126.1 recombination protein RecR [Rhodospirillales bacterium]
MSHPPFEQLVRQFSGLPGLGPRSAKRIALHILTEGKETLQTFANTLLETAEKMSLCSVCGNLDVVQPCHICSDPKRDRTSLCIVSGLSDLWAIERTSSYRGYYHVLGGVLSALNGVRPEQLRMEQLRDRLADSSVEEVILALSATVDGQTTAHYVTDVILKASHNQIKISRLAHGMPVGGELDYLDDGTIMTAFKSRLRV